MYSRDQHTPAVCSIPEDVLNGGQVLGLVQVDWSHEFMMCRRVVFGKVISKVGFAWFPIHIKMSLIDSVSYPVKSHVDGFGSLYFNVIICYSTGC